MPLLSEEPRGDGTLKRKAEDEAGATSKRGYTSSSAAVEGGTVLNSIAALEAELQRRRRQEDEDRQLALLLQKELNKEEKQRATDRSKGSTDAYHLRQASSSPKGPSSTASTSTASPSAQMKKSCCRQTTLTDMFRSSSS